MRTWDDFGPDQEYGLGGDARRLLVGAFRATGIEQGKIYKHIYDGGDEFHAGSVVLEAFAGRIALEELLGKGLVHQESKQVYVLTPEGAQVAGVLAAMETPS